MNIRISRISLLSFVFAGLLVGCQNAEVNENQVEEGPLKILATTTIVEDLLRNLGGEAFEYSSLMGAGVDPHIYKPTQGDLKKLKESDAIFFNGLHLEGKMTDILVKMRREKKVIAASDAIEMDRFINDTEFDDGYDPHFWFDTDIWGEVAQYYATELIALDSTQENNITANLTSFLKKLDALDIAIQTAVKDIPDSKRVVVTSHDALNYFARKYGFQVRSLQGRSTAGELGLKDIREMVDFLTVNEIKAIFPENITGSQSLEAVIDGCEQRGHTVLLGDELFSDALGGPDSEAPDYISMMNENAKRIVTALK